MNAGQTDAGHFAYYAGYFLVFVVLIWISLYRIVDRLERIAAALEKRSNGGVGL